LLARHLCASHIKRSLRYNHTQDEATSRSPRQPPLDEKIRGIYYLVRNRARTRLLPRARRFLKISHGQRPSNPEKNARARGTRNPLGPLGCDTGREGRAISTAPAALARAHPSLWVDKYRRKYIATKAISPSASITAAFCWLLYRWHSNNASESAAEAFRLKYPRTGSAERP